MRLFLLSLLAIGSVQSLTIGYPYRSVWNYNPFFAQLPVKSGVVQGYLRYLDGSGLDRAVAYNGHEPVYAVRQFKYIPSEIPVQKSSPSSKFDEINFRSWTTLQYQNLKHDIGILRAEGKEPTQEILTKFQALEKIVIAPNFSIIADLPEVKDIMQDYAQAISSNEAVQSSNIKQNHGEIKTYTGNSNIPLVAIEESPETKQAREEHLRIYNEQIAHLKQLELEHQKNVKGQPESVKQVENAVALAELEKAQQEHFRLWNEAKLRAEQADYDGAAKTVYESAEKQQISAQTNNQNTFNLKQNQELQSTAQTESFKTATDQQSSRSDSPSNDQTLVQPQQVVVRDEHSRLVDSSSFQGLKSYIPVVQQALVPQPVVETPEVIRAREEHLRIVNEAVSRAQAVQQEEEKQRQQRIEQSSVTGSEGQAISPLPHNVEQQQIKSDLSTADYGQQSHVAETPEVIKAREEHLRLVQEANLRAQFVEQQESKYKHQSQTPILKTQYPHEQLEYHSQITQTGIQETPDVTNAREQHSRLVTEVNSKPNSDVQVVEQQRSVESHGIEETPEVKRAREEHLRIYNAIKNQVEQEKSLNDERRSSEAIVTQQLNEYSTEEERILEMERLRETERLQKEQQLLEMERIREAERLAEEKRNMEAELIRLRIEDEQRLEMERLLELQRLQQEQEELQKLKSEGYQEIIIKDSAAFQQPQQIAIVSNEQSTGISSTSNANLQSTAKYGHNPYLRISPVVNEPVYTVPLQHSVNHQQEISAFAHSPFLKSSAVNVPGAIHHHQPVDVHVNEQSVNEPSVRYVQSPQHSGGGNKHQHIKDDHYVKHKYQDNASTQPADTAEVLIALERATKDHFRAHELALEQLRLARLQNPQLKDCN